jgi:hypothetical protein
VATPVRYWTGFAGHVEQSRLEDKNKMEGPVDEKIACYSKIVQPL